MNEAMRPLYILNGVIFDNIGEFLSALSYEERYGSGDLEIREIEDHSNSKDSINHLGGRHAVQQQ